MSNDNNLTGSILIAHPSLRDPHFRKTLLFLSHHSEEEGATGLVLNRPLDQTLSQLSGLPEIPVFYGGPIETDQIVLASLQWRDVPTVVAFRAFAGTTTEMEIDSDWHPGLRAFAGYSGWSSGQLEAEIEEQAWLVIPPTREIVEMPDPQMIWKKLMRE
ncbi:MAG: YqgE/AlgH family protein, partial [Terrimicrobiaceae bacterium]